MKNIVISFVVVLVSIISFYGGWRYGHESNWYRNIHQNSSLKIGPYEKTDWRKVSSLKGGYEVWVDADEVALAVTKEKSAILMAMDFYNKKVLDGVAEVDASFKKSDGLYVSFEKKDVSYEVK